MGRESESVRPVTPSVGFDLTRLSRSVTAVEKQLLSDNQLKNVATKLKPAVENHQYHA